MTKGRNVRGQPLFLVPALIATLTAIGAWAMWPICMAGSCLGTESETVESSVSPTAAVVLPSQARPAPSVEGAPVRVPAESGRASARSKPPAAGVKETMRDPDPVSIVRAVPAQPPNEAFDADSVAWDESPEPDHKIEEADGAPAGAGGGAEGTEFAWAAAEERWTALTETALWDPDDARRGEAIDAIGLHRDDDAMVVLIEVALSDMEASNRYEAVQSIWRAMADGVGDEVAAREALTLAADDVDPNVAELAQRALEDLMELERRRAEQ